jgi:glycosyltransferase involved in cell wall biosynthesis
MSRDNTVIAAVIPAYKVSQQIAMLLNDMPDIFDHIIVVDDCCPEDSGELVLTSNFDPRVEVIFHTLNQGVGGAVISGYRRALSLGAQIVVKIDGDGQMDPHQAQKLIDPILAGQADYTKGNRFFEIEAIKCMPKIRIIGNLILSFLTKLSTGYWRVFDPNNGFTAIKSETLKLIPLDKIDRRYFFESDMLFRLNLSNSVVKDISIPASYGNENSSLVVWKIVLEFPRKHMKNFIKRILYTYYLREFNLASIELPVGLALFSFGLILGSTSFLHGLFTGSPTEIGALVLIAMSTLAGLQMVLAFFAFDIQKSEPTL